jgi:hypothetical protein
MLLASENVCAKLSQGRGSLIAFPFQWIQKKLLIQITDSTTSAMPLLRTHGKSLAFKTSVDGGIHWRYRKHL